MCSACRHWLDLTDRPRAVRVGRGRRAARTGALLLLFVAGFAANSAARAQAWLPPAGAFSTALTYNDTLNLKHYMPDGSEADAGHTRTHAYGLGVAYSPTDRIMLTAGLPYVTTRYWGARPHPTEVDDGDEHSAFTDLRVSAHYQLVEAPLAVAPYVAYVTPVTSYETLGHAAPGRGLDEVWFGVWLGKNLDAWLPRTYFQSRVNYAVVEQVAGIKHDRTNVDVELGYFLSPRWSVRAMGFWQVTHGGVDVPMPPSNPLYPYHDQLAAEEYTNVGIGAAFSATANVSLYATGITSLSGRNGHKLDQGLTLGLSYGFAPLR
jgi:hypothetical protein